MTDKELQKINLIIAEALGYTKIFGSGWYQNPEQNKIVKGAEGFEFHNSWDILIPIFSVFRQINMKTMFSEHRNYNTQFMLGVGSNDISQSFIALGNFLQDTTVINKLILNGFAPGNYFNRCGNTDCGVQFIGDKHAVRCSNCAMDIFMVSSLQYSKSAMFTEKKKFIKQIIWQPKDEKASEQQK